jgi:hypothetical protein
MIPGNSTRPASKRSLGVRGWFALTGSKTFPCRRFPARAASKSKA